MYRTLKWCGLEPWLHIFFFSKIREVHCFLLFRIIWIVKNKLSRISFIIYDNRFRPFSYGCINLYSSYLTLSPWITIWMKFCPRKMIITSEFDESGVLCGIWKKCVCVYFFDINVLFWCNGAASLVVGGWSKTHNKFNKKIYTYHILFICYTIQQIHQILKW